MGFEIVDGPGVLIPMLTCDTCKKQIVSTEDGWIYWEMTQPKSLYFVHRKDCKPTSIRDFEDRFGGHWLNMGLSEFIAPSQARGKS